MRTSKRWLMIPVAVGLLAVAACTSDHLDDGTSADVVLEVQTFENPPVTAQITPTGDSFCSMAGTTCVSSLDCPPDEVCIQEQVCELRVVDWSATMRNQPKNDLAAEPFNDIVLQSVTITYSNPAWSINGQTRVVGLGGIVVPAGGTAQVTFSPISFDDLDAGTMSSTTGNLTMTFNAVTVEGTTFNTPVSRQLFIETCL